VLYGLVGGASADAVHVLRLSEALADVPVGTRVIAILLDSESHSSRAPDEKVVLSEYLAHPALQTRTLHHRGVEVRLIVTGVSGGGIFTALASAASKVWIAAGGRLSGSAAHGDGRYQQGGRRPGRHAGARASDRRGGRGHV